MRELTSLSYSFDGILQIVTDSFMVLVIDCGHKANISVIEIETKKYTKSERKEKNDENILNKVKFIMTIKEGRKKEKI